MMYEERIYRALVNDNLIKSVVVEEESDLQVLASVDFKSLDYLRSIRQTIANYIEERPAFQKSFEPIERDENADALINHMIVATEKAQVGPMASVAGAVSEYVGKAIRQYAEEVIVENGGDIYMDCKVDKEVLVFAGQSILSNRIAIEIRADQMPIGICTSSGTIGHSVSFGKADAVVVLSKDTPLADATATSVCNIIKSKDDINKGIEFAKNIDGIMGILIIVGDNLGAWGDVKLVKKESMTHD